TARLAVLLQGIDEPSLGRKEQVEQSASLPNRGSALVGLLDGHAMFLGFVAQCQKLLAGWGRSWRLRRRWQRPGTTRQARHAAKLGACNKWIATIKAASSRARQSLMAL